MADSPERLQPNSERGVEGAREAAEKQAERLRSREVEKSPENHQENLERARTEADKEALFSKEAGKEQKAAAMDSSEPSVRRISKKDKEDAFKTTMNRTQRHLKAPERAFSKFIHNKAVEKTSEVLGASIARPDALLGGGISAFVLTALVYIIARSFGYPLSGFETIATFILGFLLGLLYDFLKAMITGKKM